MLPDSPPTTAFTIEGNIGCGKSTFLRVIQNHFPQLIIIEEPVDQWQNMAKKGINMLEKYYKDSVRYGFTFLNYAAFSRVRRFIEKEGHTGIYTLSQRSILSDKHVFGPLMADIGFMTPQENQLFLELYVEFESMLRSPLPKVIYLKCSPEVCSERTKKRQRTGEDAIPFSYFQKLHSLHEKWMNESDESNMLVVDTSEDFENNPESISDMVHKLRKFIYGEQKLVKKETQETRAEETETGDVEAKKQSESLDSKSEKGPSSSEENSDNVENLENENELRVEKKQSLIAQ